MTLRQYVMGLWSASSQFFNVLLFLGHPNESISGRSYRQPWPLARKLINTLFFWQKDHCKSAYMNDVKWAENYLLTHRQRQDTESSINMG